MFSVGSQSSAPGSFDDENVSINFFHKTVKEFLASQYLECSGEVRFSSFCSSCSSLQSVMELLNILKFSVGLQPNLGSTVSEHIAQSANYDTVIKYSQGFDGDIWDGYRIEPKVREMFKTVSDCHIEVKYSLTKSETRKQIEYVPSVRRVCS